jgi:hypothetical protein
MGTPYDHESDWSFEVVGTLALDRSAFTRDSRTVTVPRMAWSEATHVPSARALERKRIRARARRNRGIAALVVLSSVLVSVLLLTAFGSSDATSAQTTGPAPAQRLLPAGPPRPQVVAMNESLRILLPINSNRVTAIGYHATGAGALALEPVGTRANAGFLGRMARKLFGGSGSGLRYYLLDGGTGPRTAGLDVGAPVGTDVYAPTDGTVIAMTDRIVNGRLYGAQIDIQPSGNPDLVLSIANLRPDQALTVGSTVSAARTKIGRIVDLSRVERAGLARFTQDKGHHVHIEVHAAASLLTP